MIKILLMEDDLNLCQSIQQALKKEGYSVLSAILLSCDRNTLYIPPFSTNEKKAVLSSSLKFVTIDKTAFKTL